MIRSTAKVRTKMKVHSLYRNVRAKALGVCEALTAVEKVRCERATYTIDEIVTHFTTYRLFPFEADIQKDPRRHVKLLYADYCTLRDETAVGARADEIFAADYKRAFPKKRAGTKDWQAKKIETRGKAIEIARRELREGLERELGRARRTFAERAPDLDKLEGKARGLERLAGWGDLVAALASLDFVGGEARDAERCRAVIARWADAPTRLRQAAETARKTAEHRRREWAELEAEAKGALES